MGQRSIRSLAWMGDAQFELDLRIRIAARGDWPVERLDRIRSKISCAESQAALLSEIEDDLDDSEAGVVRRGKNASVRSSGRVQRDVKAYRAATGFEALIAFLSLQGEEGRDRLVTLLEGPLEAAIDRAFASTEPIKRR